MSLKKTVFFLFVLFAKIAFSQSATKQEVLQVARNFLTKTSHFELINSKPNTKPFYSNKNGEILFYILNYDKAFIVISSNKNNTPIKAFSFKNSFNISKNNQEIGMLDILISDYENYNTFIKKNKELKNINSKKWQDLLNNNTSKNTNDETIGPLLSSEYGQQKPKDANGNYIIVTNYFTPQHYSVGCVAITLTELLQYYQWPRIGEGKYSYTDNYGSSKGTYTANFEEKYYNWSAVLDKYKNTISTDAQRKELGKIAFHAATSINMDYESGGSTSNINRIPNAVKSYFRYIADYKNKSESDFWQVLDENLHNKIPAQFAIYTPSGSGHAVVGDGIKYVGTEKYYHLNMGWWGTTNGWYQIHQSFNAGGYTNITAATLNMIPVPEMDKKPKIDFENKTATLKWYYPEKIPAQNFELQIKKGLENWETLTDTFTNSFSYEFKPEKENIDYSFRIRAKVHDNWYDNSWSNTISVKQSDFIEKGDKELTLYPNVASSEIIVSYNNLEGSTIKIFNLNGGLVYQSDEEITNEKYNINVSNFEPGIYIINVLNDNEQISEKFLKL